jgi:methyl-accepting chemotaxis protein
MWGWLKWSVTENSSGDSDSGSDQRDQDTLGNRKSQSDDINISTGALLDTLPQPAFIIDTQHRVTAWNREMEVMTGIDREEVLGDDDTATFFRDDRTETLANAVVENPDRADETFGAER